MVQDNHAEQMSMVLRLTARCYRLIVGVSTGEER